MVGASKASMIAIHRGFYIMFSTRSISFKAIVAPLFTVILSGTLAAQSQSPSVQDDAKAVEIINRAVEYLGGERYLNVTSLIGRGKYSQMRDGTVVSFQSFVDVIVLPDKERTEFKNRGSRTVQAYSGETGWVFDGDQEVLRSQNEAQLAEFKRGLRVSLDYLLRGYWKGSATLTYVGKRQATLGKRNDVIKLSYNDGLEVEFEFSADNGVPAKAVFKRPGSGDEETIEEDRYAQFVEFSGVRVPLVIDRFTNGKQSSRINYENVELNKPFTDSMFSKPANAKQAKKDLIL